MAGNCTEVFFLTTSYLKDLDWGMISGFIVLGILTLGSVVIYIEKMVHLSQRHDIKTSVKINMRVLLSLYPMVAVLSFISLFFLKAVPLIEFGYNLHLSLCIFIFMKKIISEFGGTWEMSRILADEKLPSRSPPCCCCCRCLPRPLTTRRDLVIFQVLVLQMTVVRPILLFIASVFAYSRHKFSNGFDLSDPVFWIKLVGNVSTGLALYGLIVVFRLTRTHLKGANIVLKFVCLKLSLLFIDFQTNLLQMLAGLNAIPCIPPFGPTAAAWFISGTMLVVEMLGLSLLSRYVYRKKYDLLDINDNMKEKEPLITKDDTELTNG